MEAVGISKSEYAYQAIRSLIISGQLSAGTLISESALSRQLEISRTPAREAIRLLISEGFIDSEGSFSRVHSMSLKEIYDLNEVRLHLEEMAMNTSISRIPEAELNTLINEWSKILQMVDGSIYNREPVLKRIRQLDNVTHLLIIRHCDNAVIPKLYENLLAKVNWSQSMISTLIKNDRKTIQYHMQLLRQLQERNIHEAKQILRAHIYDSLEGISEKRLLKGYEGLPVPNWS